MVNYFVRQVMIKKPMSMEIPESLASSLDELAKRSGRKKNLLLAASLHYFVKATEDEQEKMIRRYIGAYQK